MRATVWQIYFADAVGKVDRLLINVAIGLRFPGTRLAAA